MKKTITLLLLLPWLTLAQVGVNTTTPKAALDVESANNGMLIPRVQLTSILDITTVVNPNAGPLEISTLVYNMAPAGIAPNNVIAGYYYWNGSRWIAIGGNATTGWGLNGNAGTNPPSTINAPFAVTENFIGTTGYEDLVFGANNISRMKISAFGNVGIGIPNPNAKLHINNNSPYITGWITKTNVDNGFSGYVSPTLVVSTTSTLSEANETNYNAQFFSGGSNIGTNVGARFAATGAANNYAIIVPENSGNVGFGTNTPTSKLHIETTDENTGITNNLTKNTDTGTSYTIDNNITINNNNQSYGIRNSFLGTGSGLKIGALNTASAGVLGSKIGFENNLQASGNSYLFGFRNTLTHSGSDLTLGLYNQITNPTGSTGTTHGIENRITNNSTLEATGVYTEINSPNGGGGGTYGVQNIIGGLKTGGKFGVSNTISSNIADTMVGISNSITSTINGGSIVGLENNINANSNTPVSGNLNQLGGTGNSNVNGVYSFITNSGTGNHTGILSNLSGTGSGSKIGTYTYIDPAAGGTHYGIFSEVLKPGNNFAARFLGKVTIGTNASIGVDNYVFPMTRGTNGQIMQTDGAGNLSWQNPGSVISNTSWAVNGNTVFALDFMGSTNNADVRFRRSNISAGFIGETNTAFGVNALDSATGLYNVAIGRDALTNLGAADQNVAVGWNALSNVTTGGNNIGIGTGATVPTATANNQIRMGNVNIGYAGIQVAWSITSDSRWKSDIQPSNLGLNFINTLNPVSYFRKNDTSQKTEYGFIAQELDKTLTDFGASNNGIITKDDDGMLSVRYNDLIAPMVKAIQELKTENDSLKQQNEALENRLKAIENKLK
jgi:hypothetical protein